MDIDEDHFLKWSEELRPLIRWFSEIFLAKRISSMALSFRTIPIKKTAHLLGLDLDTSVQILQANGWTLSEDRKVWTPCKPDLSSFQANSEVDELAKGLEHFNLMAKLAIRSET
ncbi:hypothetical protein DSO57_1011492 [Entomophthora muscae]|uniref:Uncharacterized protein n=1 Tax=Entomophthora muscae TaxID=34485 RepID=A0ACC2TTY4_9FUNG|nr:hypothetical protein DSO57_1011492 [Entomophthora muscae]